MNKTPDTREQIVQSHAGLIHRVVMHCNNPGSIPDIEQVLQQAEQNDWTQLVTTIRSIMAGNREESILLGLDEEDRIIVEAILRGHVGIKIGLQLGHCTWILEAAQD